MSTEDLFFDEQPLITDIPEKTPWKLMVIDDDKVLHALTRMVFEGFRFQGRNLNIMGAYSGQEAKKLIRQHPDTHVMLLDVVMETDHAGLKVVDYVRHELKNKFVRIILRTGQAGLAPEHQVIMEYDINDYKEKSDLTAQKLITAVTASLRNYNDLKTIEQLSINLQKTNQRLQEEIKERIHVENTMRKLSTALEQTADTELITDKNGLIEYVNHAFESVTGYCKMDIMGNTPSFLKSGKQSRTFYKKLWTTILQGDVFSDIFINKKKDGSIFYEEKTITPLKDEHNNITHFVATGKDISERIETPIQYSNG